MIVNKVRSTLQSLMLARKLVNYFLSPRKEVDHDLIFIRHAQSEFNVACEEYRRSHKIPYVWKELCNHEGFDQKVLFNMRYVDCAITENGRLECVKKRGLLKSQNIDCVLVSPQMRALETCEEIFKGREIPIIVQPLLVGPLRSCSDISNSMNYKKLIFPHFNFAKTDECEQLWYLDYLPQEQQEICYSRFQEKGLVSPDSKRAELLELLKEGKIAEDAIQYRKRIDHLKNVIMGYKRIFPRIAVVSHYYTIEYISAVDYQKCGTPKFYIDVQNCTPYYARSSKLFSKVGGKANNLI